jgi:hypothetical protein
MIIISYKDMKIIYWRREMSKRFYRASPVLAGGNRYYVPTAYGTREKAVSEAEKWIAHNKLVGEVWNIEVQAVDRQ